MKIVVQGDLTSGQFKSVFNSQDHTFRLDTSTFEEAELYLKGDNRVISLEKYTPPKPPPKWYAKLNSCCVKSGIPPDTVGWKKLSAIPFNRKKSQFISLFADTKTSDALSSLSDRNNIRGPRELGPYPIARIKALVRAADGDSPIVFMGHTEGSAFRIEHGRGATVPFDVLHKIGRDANRPIILVGCHTDNHIAASEHLNDYPPIGTLNTLHPRMVASQIMKAHANASSLADFLSQISSPDMEIVVSNNFLERINNVEGTFVQATIYRRMLNNAKAIVGQVIMYIPCKLGDVSLKFP